MARMYSNPPLIEAICNFRFANSHPWDWTIPGLFYERIRDKFPHREQTNVLETIMDANQGKFVQQMQPRIQFLTEDRTTVMQIAPYNLSIHQLQPYTSWCHFNELILKYLLIYHEIANSPELIRIALHYVNRIEFSQTELELEDYFNVLPQIPDPIPQVFPSFLVNVDIPYGTSIGGLRITFGTVLAEASDKFAYVLDLDMSSSNEYVPPINQVSGWLDTAHYHIKVAFDASFTNRARHDIFEEVSK